MLAYLPILLLEDVGDRDRFGVSPNVSPQSLRQWRVYGCLLYPLC